MKERFADWDYVDTWREMQKLVETGKVKNIGVSNFGITHLERLLADPSCKVSSFPMSKPSSGVQETMKVETDKSRLSQQ
jgi:aryl-alcohol dehydrogenase-like predicted oxidoreductase